MDHTMLARVFMLRAQVVTASIEVEAMKAANKEREMNGEALAYPEKAFMELANDVRGISADLFNMTY
jgi:hypothetical protein